MPGDPNYFDLNGNFAGTPSTQTSGGSTSSTSASGPGSAYYWLSLALQGASSYANYSSARQANRTNIGLQQDQLAWEERMADTAVQRRANDIQAAGGNRALAFTNGSEASTPTVAPAHVEPAQLAPINLLTAKLAEQQYRQGEATIRLTNAQAQRSQTEADVISGSSQSELDLRNARNIKEREWLDIKQRILEHTDTKTGAEAKQLDQGLDSMLTIIKNNAEASNMNTAKLKELFDASGIDTNANWFQKAFSLILFNLLNRAGK